MLHLTDFHNADILTGTLSMVCDWKSGTAASTHAVSGMLSTTCEFRQRVLKRLHVALPMPAQEGNHTASAASCTGCSEAGFASSTAAPITTGPGCAGAAGTLARKACPGEIPCGTA